MNEMHNNNVGKKIRDLRYERGISASALGEAVNLSTPFVYDLEKGRSYPRLSTLINLATYFDVSIDYLLGRTKHKGTFLDDEQQPEPKEPPVVVSDDGLFFRMKHTPLKMHIVPVLSRESLVGNGAENIPMDSAMEYLVWPQDKITALVRGLPSQPPYALYLEDTDYLSSLGIHRGDKIVVAPRSVHEQGALSLVMFYGFPTFWYVYSLDGENILLQNDRTELLLTPEEQVKIGYKFLGLAAGVVSNRPAPRPLMRRAQQKSDPA